MGNVDTMSLRHLNSEAEFDEAYEFKDGQATIVKDGLEGCMSFDEEEGDYSSMSAQER